MKPLQYFCDQQTLIFCMYILYIVTKYFTIYTNLAKCLPCHNRSDMIVEKKHLRRVYFLSCNDYNEQSSDQQIPFLGRKMIIW